MPKLKILPGRGRGLIATILLSAWAAAASAAAPTAQQWRCTNPASDASWTITVDPASGRVDHLPATITKRWVSWRDPDRGFFDLDRGSGELQMRNASSTGGYFMHFHCRQE